MTPADWCHSHARREPAAPGDHRACGECGHVFRSEGELMAADYLAAFAVWEAADDPSLPMPRLLDVTEIYVCPHCTHDL